MPVSGHTADGSHGFIDVVDAEPGERRSRQNLVGRAGHATENVTENTDGVVEEFRTEPTEHAGRDDSCGIVARRRFSDLK
ncbi:hypothetical protein [Actinomadura alba]|uniref:hypothetical protein n=1 Tax=Actinomadura alba TaxID=406431 RepID=UPI0031E3A43D